MMGWESGCRFGSRFGLWGTHHMGSGLGTLFGGLLGLLFLMGLLAVFAVGIIWIARRAGATNRATVSRDDVSALQLAQQRLALGEISVEEYQRIREQLET